MSRLVPMALVITVIAMTAIWFSGRPSMQAGLGSQGAMVEVTVPELTAIAEMGQQIFDENCAVCHGAHAAGNDGSGPPLVHIIYEPNHHADPAFYLAARNGVRQHHWKFGDMAPVPGVTEADVTAIIAYVRELQRANGIH